MFDDLRYAYRRLLRSPGFTVTAIAILGLAIGANTAVFSMLNALILRPLPVERPQDLVFLTQGRNGQNQSFPNYRDFRDRTKTLSGLTAYRIAVVALSRGTENARVWGYEVTGNYFQLLGVRPALGRFFMPAEDTKVGGDPYIVLSYAAWQHRFGGDRQIVNASVKINGLAYSVLGVAPRGFLGTELLYAPEFWVPMSMEPQIEPGNNWLESRMTWNVWVLGRLRAGVSREAAQNEIQGIAAQLVREHPKENDGMKVHFTQPGLVGEWLRGPVKAFTTVIMSVAGLVLLIACSNLASFLLARATDARKETAIRLALGAGRMRVLGQFLTESLVLAIFGGAAALLLAWWLTSLVTTAGLPFDFPLNKTLSVDFRVLAFSAAISLSTVLLFGLVPAIQASRPDVVPALKNEAWSRRLRRFELRDVFVTGQIALSVVLIVASVLVVHSLQNALTVNVGFEPRNAASVSFDLGDQGYTEAQGIEFQRRILQRVQQLPGIEAASISNTIPLSLDVSHTIVYVYGKPAPRRSETPSAIFYFAGPNFFHTLQTRIIEGRDFDWRDTRDAPRVAIINTALANRLFPNEDAIGKRIGQGGAWYQVIGVAETGKYESLNDENQPALFWPMLQRYDSITTIVARSHIPAQQLIATLRRAVHDMDPTMPLFDVGTLENHLALPLTPARLAASALGGFGFLAIALAAVGIYGAMAYSVARRTREIGIRVAIGARRSDVLGLVTARAAAVLSTGTLFGTAVALAIGKFFNAVLYGVSPKDPATFAIAVVLMCVVALVAC
ncbi:MAG: ABC transporter permease, partial [Acidobacteriaceae bacterium]|nr:ABC transporter permease [Acidobacteriaceae bacterium]